MLFISYFCSPSNLPHPYPTSTRSMIHCPRTNPGLKLVPHEYGEQYGVPIELVPNAGKSGLLHYSKIPFDPFEPNAQEQLDGRSKLTLTVTNSVKLTYPLGYIHGEKPDRGYN